MNNALWSNPWRRAGRVVLAGLLACVVALGVVLTLGRMAQASAPAQPPLPNQPVLHLGDVDASNFPTVTMAVWAEPAPSATSPVLSNEALTVVLNGLTPTLISKTQTSAQDLALDVVVIVDTVISSDTQHVETQRMVTSALASLSSTLGQNGRVISWIAATAGAPMRVVSLDKLVSTIGPTTNMTQALQMALNVFLEAGAYERRRAILIVSDQGGNWLERLVPQADIARWVAQARQARAPIYAALYASNAGSQRLISALPDSGGRAITPTRQKLGAELETLMAPLRSGLQLTVMTNANQVKVGRPHTFSVGLMGYETATVEFTAQQKPITFELDLKHGPVVTKENNMLQVALTPSQALIDVFAHTATVAYRLEPAPHISLWVTTTAPFTQSSPFSPTSPFVRSWPRASLIGEATRIYTLTAIITDYVGNVGQQAVRITVPTTFVIQILGAPVTGTLPYTTTEIPFSVRSNYPLLEGKVYINRHTRTVQSGLEYTITTAPNNVGYQKLWVTGRDEFGQKDSAQAEIRIAGIPWFERLGPAIVVLIAVGLLLGLAAWLWRTLSQGRARFVLGNTGNVPCRYEIRAELDQPYQDYSLALQHHGFDLKTVPELAEKGPDPSRVSNKWWLTPELLPGQTEQLVLRVDPHSRYAQAECKVKLISRLCTTDATYFGAAAKSSAPDLVVPKTVPLPHHLPARALTFLVMTALAVGVVSSLLVQLSTSGVAK